MEGQLITKTNLLINQDDLLLAQNHSIYEKLAEHIAKTEKWEKVLLENNPNSDNNSNPNSNANPNLTPKTI